MQDATWLILFTSVVPEPDSQNTHNFYFYIIVYES